MALSALAAALPDGDLLDAPAQLDDYATDRSTAPPVSPRAVVRARSTADVSATMRWASEHGVPVTPRGAGTGKAGGCVASPGGIVLSLASMDRVLRVSAGDGWAEVEPGVVTGEFRDAMEQDHRLFYPPDPASLDVCTLGGNVATNAGGPVAMKYGVTGDHVLGVTAVLPDGSVVQTGRRQPKSVAGYDLTSLLIGSEGTLGVLVELRLALQAVPRETVAALIPFDTAADAVGAVVSGRRAGVQPRALELFDRVTLARLVAQGVDRVQPEWGALLLAEFDGGPGEAEAAAARFADALDRPPRDLRFTRSTAERAALWALRRETSELVKVGAAGWISEDVAVPLSSMPAMLQRLYEIGDRHDLAAFAYGHAGDGNLHVNLVWDEGHGQPRAEVAAREVMDAALRLGGTISGEHGIGTCKRRFLPGELGERSLGLQRSIKQLFDPRGILNPGKVFA